MQSCLPPVLKTTTGVCFTLARPRCNINGTLNLDANDAPTGDICKAKVCSGKTIL